MAANNSQLRWLLYRYISSGGEGKERTREALQTTSVDDRYSLLMSVKAGPQWTAVHRGVVLGDLDSIQIMMSGFSSDQSYDIVEMQDSHSNVVAMTRLTPLHLAASKGHTDITKFLLSKLSQEQRFNILKMSERYGSTVVHLAAKSKQTADLLAMLTSVSADQQKKLLNIKDFEGKTIADITPLPELLYNVVRWTSIELEATNQKMAEVEKQQKATIEQHKVDSAKQREDSARLSDKCEQQGQELSRVKQKMRALNSEVQNQRESNVRLCRSSGQQGEALDVTNQRLAEVEKQQKATIEQLKLDLDRQTEDNLKLRIKLANPPIPAKRNTISGTRPYDTLPSRNKNVGQFGRNKEGASKLHESTEMWQELSSKEQGSAQEQERLERKLRMNKLVVAGKLEMKEVGHEEQFQMDEESYWRNQTLRRTVSVTGPSPSVTVVAKQVCGEEDGASSAMAVYGETSECGIAYVDPGIAMDKTEMKVEQSNNVYTQEMTKAKKIDITYGGEIKDAKHNVTRNGAGMLRSGEEVVTKEVDQMEAGAKTEIGHEKEIKVEPSNYVYVQKEAQEVEINATFVGGVKDTEYQEVIHTLRTQQLRMAEFEAQLSVMMKANEALLTERGKDKAKVAELRDELASRPVYL